MKVILVILFISFAIFQSQSKPTTSKATENTFDSSFEDEGEFTESGEACAEELHLNKLLILHLNSKVIAPEDNDEYNQYLYCYWQKQQFIDNNGEVNYEKLLNSTIEMAETNFDDEDSELKSLVINNINITIGFCEKVHPNKDNKQIAVKIQNCITTKLNEIVEDYYSSELTSKEVECIDELHLNKQQIKKLNSEDGPAGDNDDYNNFLACYWKKEEWMDNNGNVNYENLLFSLTSKVGYGLHGQNYELKSGMKKKIIEAVTYCQAFSSKGRNQGQTIIKLQNCIAEKLTK